jgi:hypothetical protein
MSEIIHLVSNVWKIISSQLYIERNLFVIFLDICHLQVPFCLNRQINISAKLIFSKNKPFFSSNKNSANRFFGNLTWSPFYDLFGRFHQFQFGVFLKTNAMVIAVYLAVHIFSLNGPFFRRKYFKIITLAPVCIFRAFSQ